MIRRRHFSALPALLAASPLPLALPARAEGRTGLSELDAGKGLKAALERGAVAAVQTLGRPDGFLGNAKVRIPLPATLKDAGKLLSALGQRRQLEELETAMNRAAENAVPRALKLLTEAVRGMSVTDARDILAGGDTSVTQFFASKTRTALAGAFLPVVQQATAKVGLAQTYDRLASQAAGFGLLRQEDASIDRYVTRKALDGLYYVIGEEERRIRRDPVGTGSALLGRVFGALR